MQVRSFLLACPSPLPLGAAVFSTPVSCMQLSALLFFGAHGRAYACAGVFMGLASSRRQGG